MEQVRTWFGKPLWDMLSADADSYFGTVLPDPLHLAVVFGLDETTAIRYCAAARQILQTPAEEHDPPG